MRITDGKGHGHEAGVTEDNRLMVSATTQSLEHTNSHEEEQVYFANIATTDDSLTITATGGTVLVMQNNSTVRDIVIHEVFIGTGAADMIFKVVRNPTLDTLGNMNEQAPGNLNFSSGNIADVSVWNWDEVGDGITGVSDGTVLNAYLFQAGHHVLPFDDALIVPNNAIISFEFSGAGEATLGVRFHMEDIINL